MADRIKPPSMLDARRRAMVVSTVTETLAGYKWDVHLSPRDFAEHAAAAMFDRIYEEDAELKHLRATVNALLDAHLGIASLMPLSITRISADAEGKPQAEHIDPWDFYVHPSDRGEPKP